MAYPGAVSELYKDTFGANFRLFRSPGRINLIGEHTDYNLGLVLPAAIDKAIYIAIGKRTDNTVQLLSADFDYTHSQSLDDLKPAWKLWAPHGAAGDRKPAADPPEGRRHHGC